MVKSGISDFRVSSKKSAPGLILLHLRRACSMSSTSPAVHCTWEPPPLQQQQGYSAFYSPADSQTAHYCNGEILCYTAVMVKYLPIVLTCLDTVLW